MQFLVDWVTLNFGDDHPLLGKHAADPDHLFDDIIEGHEIFFDSASRTGNFWVCKTYGVQYEINSGAPVRPHCLRFSGNGCAAFGHKLIGSLLDPETSHLSRVDLAFDAEISQSVWHSFVLHVLQSDIDGEDLVFSHSENRFNIPKVEYVGRGDARTFYFGSRRSPLFLRVYNKTLESPESRKNGDTKKYFDDGENYVIRFELEIKRYTRTLRGKKQLYDPTPFLVHFLLHESSVFHEFHNIVKTLCPDHLLNLVDWDQAYRDLYNTSQQNQNFVQYFFEDAAQEEDVWEQISILSLDNLTVSRGALHTAEMFGHLVCACVINPHLWAVCREKFRERTRLDFDRFFTVLVEGHIRSACWLDAEDVDLSKLSAPIELDRALGKTSRLWAQYKDQLRQSRRTITLPDNDLPDFDPTDIPAPIIEAYENEQRRYFDRSGLGDPSENNYDEGDFDNEV